MERVNSSSGDKLKVFISYSRKELTTADAICTALEANGFDVILDRRDLPYGAEWQKELADFIVDADAVVWLVTPASVDSSWCLWELGEATRLSKRLVPVGITAIDPAKLPEALGKIQLLPAEGTFTLEDHLSALCDTLKTDRARIKKATRLLQSALFWQSSGRPSGHLLSGSALKEVVAAPPPSGEIQEYVRASLKARQRQKVKMIMTALALIVPVLVLACVAYLQR